MRHGADRHDTELFRQVHIRRALEIFRHFMRQPLHHFVVPGAGKAPAHAEVGKFKRVFTPRQLAELLDGRHFQAQAVAPFAHGRIEVEAAEIQFIDDVQHENLEAHHVHLRTGRVHQQGVAIGADVDELALEAEHRQKVDEIALHEAQGAQIGQLVVGKRHRAQVVELFFQLALQLGQGKGGGVAADKFVFGMGIRMTVQQCLPHCKFIQIGFQQTAHYRGHVCFLQLPEARIVRHRKHFSRARSTMAQAGALASNSGKTSADVASRAPRSCMAARKSRCCASKPATGLMQSVSKTRRARAGLPCCACR